MLTFTEVLQIIIITIALYTACEMIYNKYKNGKNNKNGGLS